MTVTTHLISHLGGKGFLWVTLFPQDIETVTVGKVGCQAQKAAGHSAFPVQRQSTKMK